MFPKITNYVELLSEDDVWDAVKDGKEINVLILENIPGYIGIKKYQPGYIEAINAGGQDAAGVQIFARKGFIDVQ